MKKFINKILDVPKLIFRLWIILWLCLIILLIMKFCFGIWYPIVVKNESFMNICNFIDENKWLSLIVMGIFYVLNINIITLLCTNKKKYDNWLMLIIANIIIIGNYVVKYFNSIIGNIIEILMIITYIVINIKQNNFKNKLINILLPLIFYGLLNLWQLTIYFVRGLDLNALNTYPSLIYIILQLDYYIFTIINWIGVSFMGLLGMGWLWSKDITVLKAEKEKELAKKNPDTKLIEKIDERIAILEKESK